MAKNKYPLGDKRKIKGILYIGNIFISMLCILSILGYFLMPLWEIKVSVTLTPEIVEKYAPQEGEGSSGDSDDPMQNILSSIFQSLSESDLKLELKGITLDTYTFVEAATGGSAEPIKKLLDSNINGIMNGLSDIIDTAITPLVKSVAVTAVTEGVKTIVKEAMESSSDLDEETKKALGNMGFTEDFIGDSVETIMNSITADDASVDSVSAGIMTVYDEVVAKIKDGDNAFSDKFNEISDEDKDKIHDYVEIALKEALSQIAAEDGSIDIEELLSEFLITQLSTGEEGTGESGEAYAYNYSSNVVYADDSESSKEELKAKILAAIMEQFNDETISTTAKVMKYIGYLLLFTFFTWAYLILKIIVKISAKNPGIKLKLPMWLGYIPYTILVLIPTGIITALKYGAVDSLVGEGAADIKVIMDAIDITFSSGAVFSFVSAIILFVFSFFYGHYRRKLKKIIKYEKQFGIDY